MTYQNHSDDKAAADEASSLFLSSGDAKPKKTNGVPTMRARIATCLFLLGTLAMIYGGSRSSSSGSSTPNSGTVAVVTSDDSCATEVPGAGPCCDGHPLYDVCHQVCDWLLLCDEGYVPELTDDEATRFPETSDYQPYNCHCRGYDDHNGCFCRQVREMVYKFENNDLIGDCDPCRPPPTPAPTPSPVYDPSKYDPTRDYCFLNTDTVGKFCWNAADSSLPYGNWIKEGTHNYNDCGPECPAVRRVYDPSHGDYCFYDRNTVDKHCWYPPEHYPYGNWELVHRSYDNCGPKCTMVYKYDPSWAVCFKDEDNVDKYCWYWRDDNKFPHGNWDLDGSTKHGLNCGPMCTDVY